MFSDYSVRKIENDLANRIQKQNHYLHRKSHAMYSFGIYDEREMWFEGLGYPIGVCIFGIPASPALCKGIAGEEERKKVLELNRLWIKDDTPKNTETFFVSRCLKKLRQITDMDIIVSYADTEQKHLGIIYQALSFIYTGLSDKHNNWIIEGENKHSKNIRPTDKGFKKVERSRKHRYLYFNCGKIRRKQLFKKLKYKIHEYPKYKNLDTIIK